MNDVKCFIYCRQSSGSEDAGNSISIQQQLKNCLDQAAKRGLTVVDVFTDANISGKTYPRGKIFEQIALSDRSFNHWFQQQRSSKKFRDGLGAMLARLGEVGYIIVDEITRLHRSVAKSYLEQTINYEITNAQVKIIQVKGDMIDLSKFDQNLIQMLRTQINDEQIANQKKKSMESRRKLKDDGYLCNAKFYAGIYDGKKQFRFDPEKAEVVQYIFRSILEKKAYSQVYYELNIKFPERAGNAKVFYESSLRHIATQPIYAGYMYNTSGELIRCVNAPEPIITLKEFEMVQIIMEHKRQRGKHTRSDNTRKRFLPFTGFLKCGHCGSNLVVWVDKGRVLYCCKQATLVKSSECRSNSVLIDHEKKMCLCGLRAAITPLLMIAYLERAKKYRWFQEGIENIERIKQEQTRIRGKIQIAFDLFCQEILDEATYTEITRERMEEVRRLQKQTKEIELNEDFDYTSANMTLIQDMIDFLKHPDLTDTLYEELLREAIYEIQTNRDFVLVKTFMGEFELPRYMKNNKQKRVFPYGVLKAKEMRQNSLLDENTIFQIEYNYRRITKKNEPDKTPIRTKIGILKNIEIYRID